ncbi:MAG TPA: IRE (iron responsive element), partial [Pirellulales bacterium]|nr:IRE (iron responsive element) [Pirellulales bacterium]
MNRRSFVRKVTYLVLIAALLVPLSYYSQPATVAAKNEPESRGGRLAQLRDEYQLGQANLGEIDPAGETIKLATLGLRGVAANILWDRANEAKKTEDWTGFKAALDQLSKLQPNYVFVWRFQAWNVSYNISVEWDDYHDRYFWVKEGIKFLLRGTRYNQTDPRLVYDTGWFTSQKIGIADERVQFRRLFREDDDTEFPDHRLRPFNRRDNWLVGQEYFEQAISLVDDRGASIRTMNPLTFFCQPAMCQINFANGLEEDGAFEEKAKVAWEEAARRWDEYGNRE